MYRANIDSIRDRQSAEDFSKAEKRKLRFSIYINIYTG